MEKLASSIADNSTQKRRITKPIPHRRHQIALKLDRLGKVQQHGFAIGGTAVDAVFPERGATGVRCAVEHVLVDVVTKPCVSRLL